MSSIEGLEGTRPSKGGRYSATGPVNRRLGEDTYRQRGGGSVDIQYRARLTMGQFGLNIY